MRPLLVLFAASFAGCAESYIYHPAENATAEISGRPAARYDVPPESPRGDVKIASFGTTKLSAQDGGAPDIPAVHVRMIVENNDDAPWRVDTNQQLAVFNDGTRAAAIYASADVGGLPSVTVGTGEKRTIDLFYALPAGEERASKLPAFDVLWRVDTPARAVAERTPFERLRVEPQYAGVGVYGYDPFWGPYGWYDPIYFHHAWASPRPILVHRPTWRW